MAPFDKHQVLLQQSSSFFSTASTEGDSLLKKDGSFDEENPPTETEDLLNKREEGKEGPHAFSIFVKFLCSGNCFLSDLSQGSVAVPSEELKTSSANETKTEEKKSINVAQIIKVVKYCYSMALLGFSVFLVVDAILTDQTTMAQASNGWFTAALMWGLILWLGMMEGGQGSLVGLQPIAKEIYQDTHPMTYRCAILAHKGDNLNRFIVGRQFLVVLVVFVLNECTSLIEGSVIPGFSDIFIESFLGSGIAILLITVMLGQLAAEVNATTCMLDFINNHLMLYTLHLSLAIESSGLLHSTYLVQYVFAWVTGKEVETKDESHTVASRMWFWARVAFSLSITTFSVFVTGAAMMNGETTMYAGVALPVTFAFLFGLICFLGVMEAMQIALFAVVNLPKEALKHHPVAQANCDLVFSGQNFPAFLIGRQICVTLSMFLIARITTLDVDVDAGQATIFGLPAVVQDFFNTGLPGALMTTIIASLVWRIFASSFPVAFMSNPVVSLVIRLCLFLEGLGLFSAAWVLALVQKKVTGLQDHDLDIGDAHGSPPAQKEQPVHATTYGATSA